MFDMYPIDGVSKNENIKIGIRFLIGPIVKDVFSASKNDLELNEWNEKASALYSSFYEFDEDEACRFNSIIAKEHLDELKELITKIKNRLNILNDGSFELSDMITDQLRELK